jgi:AcrR family transcriptional regulator
VTDSTPRARPGRPKNPERTRQREEEILAAAAVVFARRGYADTDLEQVAKAVGVSKAAIYYYFKSKESLFLAAVDQGMRLLGEAVQARGSDVEDPLARIGEAIRAYLRFFHDHPQFVELLIQERAAFRDRKKSTYFEHRDASAQRWRDIFAGLIRDGRVRELPVERLLDVVSDQVYGAMFTAHFTGGRRSPDEQAADIIDIVIGGMLTPAERRKTGGS